MSLEPNPFTAAMIAREIPAAIRPYSMAVAAVSSFRNLEIIFTPGPIPLFCPSKPFWIDNVAGFSRSVAVAFSSGAETGSPSNRVYADCVDLSAVENASKERPALIQSEPIRLRSGITYNLLLKC